MNFNKANEINKVWSEPWLIAMADCKLDTVNLNIESINLKVSLNKSDFGIIVVFIDFLVVIIYIGFIYFLDYKQK